MLKCQSYIIYELYKNGTLSSKYIGLNHYRRYFNFLDNTPDFEDIFQNYDIILNKKYYLKFNLETQYCLGHLCQSLHEVINIIKKSKPEYYKTAKDSLKAKDVFFCNIFIMKKEDFFRYCEFIYDILFEFDRRHNFNNDEDIINYLKIYFPKDKISFQTRLQGFLAERLSTIFFKHNFKRIKIFPLICIKKNAKINKKSKKKYDKFEIIFLLMAMNWILLIIKLTLNKMHNKNH